MEKMTKLSVQTSATVMAKLTYQLDEDERFKGALQNTKRIAKIASRVEDE